MKFNLSLLLKSDSAREPFSFEMPLDDDMRYYCGKELLSPIIVSGELSSDHGRLWLDISVKYRYIAPCDRCAEPFEKENNFDGRYQIVSDDADYNEDVIECIGNIINLSDIAYENVLLSIPQKHLCSEECKGLCSKCGVNLNKGECTCGL